MDTPAGPDPDINIGGEETGIEIRDALLGLRMEMRAMHQHLGSVRNQTLCLCHC
jgi:hypothetical protein